MTALPTNGRNGNGVDRLVKWLGIPALAFAFALGIAYQRIGTVESEQADLKAIVTTLSLLVERHDERLAATPQFGGR